MDQIRSRSRSVRAFIVATGVAGLLFTSVTLAGARSGQVIGAEARAAEFELETTISDVVETFRQVSNSIEGLVMRLTDEVEGWTYA